MTDQSYGSNFEYRPDQARAAETLFEILRPFIVDGAVTNIVDFRCGDGTVLDCLARRISSELGDSPLLSEITLHGYDAYTDLLKKAEGRRFDTACEVRPCPSEKLEERCRALTDLKKVRVEFHRHSDGFDIRDIVNDKTALLCAGNSISALCKCQFELISQALKKIRPVMFAVDFNLSYMGRTNHTDLKKPFVCDSPHDLHAAENPNKYVGYISERGYLKIDVRTYSHGKGALQLFTFLRIDEGMGKRLNQAYYWAISSLVHDLFISERPDIGDDKKWKVFKKLREHFNSFFSTFGVAAILPFDKAHTFARYCATSTEYSPLFHTDTEEDMNREYTMILEEPNRHQDTFHNAYGLYTAILAKITSPLVFSLQTDSEFNTTKVDKVFIEEENKLFRKDSNIKQFLYSENDALQKSDEMPFFAIPVYYATLPLFVIAARFATKIDQKNSGQRLVLEMLDNAHKAVITAMDAADLRQRTIQQFVSLAMRPPTVPTTGQKAAAPLPYDSVSKLSAEVKALFGAHKNKPWKSWIHALPTQRLTDPDIQAVANEGEQLERDFGDALKFAMLDTPSRISNIFHQIEFFTNVDGKPEESGHDEWKPCHRARLDRSGESLCNPETWKKMLLHSEIQGSFSGDIVEYLLKKLTGMIDGSSDINGTTATDFSIVKAMFCGQYANLDSIFRFDIRRLYGFLESSGWEVDFYLKGSEIAYQEIGSTGLALAKIGGKSSSPLPDDPSVGIAELAWHVYRFVHPSFTAEERPRVKLSVFSATSGTATVDIEIPAPKILISGGSEKRTLIKKYMELTKSKDHIAFDEALVKQEKIALRFSLSRDKNKALTHSGVEGFPK